MKKFVKLVNMAVNKTLYIIDASVILKWFFEEGISEHQREAVALQNDYLYKKIMLGMPNYGMAEVLNLMGRRLPKKQAMTYFSYLLAFDIRQHEMSLELALFTFQIMEEFPGVSFYDAGYHGLALLENGTFITADQQYFAKTQKKGNIMFLKNYVLG